MVDLNALNELVFQRIKTHESGAAVREDLGRGAECVIWHWELDINRRPVPYMALRPDATNNRPQDALTVPYTWLVYDETGKGYERINKLIALLPKAYYDPPLWLSRTGAINAVDVTDIGQQTTDTSLRARLRTVRVYVYL